MVGAAFALAAAGAAASLACHPDDEASSARVARVYVSNEDSGDITVIDATTGAVVATVPVGKRPRGLRVTPDGRTLYVALSGSPKAPPGVDESTLPPADRTADGIGVVDLARLALVGVLPSGRDPETFDVTPDGATLVVSNEETAEASLVDVGAARVARSVPVGVEPEGVAVRPDGEVAYVTSETDHAVSVVDLGRGEAIASIPVGKRPRAVVFSADGARAFVSNELSASVTVIDAGAHRALYDIALGDASARPMGLALSGEGRGSSSRTAGGGA
jgi:YVTN family beta-propeller protein